jgi:hypothetical protein
MSQENTRQFPGYSDAWKNTPVVFEWYGPYEWMTKKGWSIDTAIDFMLRHHVTFINDNLGVIPGDKISMFNKLSKFAGARFVLNEMTHEESVKRNSEFVIKMKWTNSGVGKVYKPYILRFFIIDQAGKVVLSSDAKSDPFKWYPGEINISESIYIPETLKKGIYNLALAMENRNKDQQSFRLAIDVPDSNGMYIISKLKIK